MGKPKLLLPWRGTTILAHLIRQWRELGAAQIAVVVAAHDTAIKAEAKRANCDCIENPAPEHGMFSSLQTAAAWSGWNPAIQQFAVVLGDQPHLEEMTLTALVAFAAENPTHICQPSLKGRGRHPVFLPSTIFRQLPQASAGNLKEYMGAIKLEPRRIEIADPGLDLDLDTPQDYSRALKEYANRLALALILGFCGSNLPAATNSLPRVEQATIQQFRGRVVCLAEEMHRLQKSELPTNHNHLHGFASTNGQYYTLLRTSLSEALFVDERVRGRELSLKARLLPNSQLLDVTAIRSLKEGALYDLFYYCAVCDIESVSPAPCACCQGPVDLVEKPL